jgi:hypothetical protein
MQPIGIQLDTGDLARHLRPARLAQHRVQELGDVRRGLGQQLLDLRPAVGAEPEVAAVHLLGEEQHLQKGLDHARRAISSDRSAMARQSWVTMTWLVPGWCSSSEFRRDTGASAGSSLKLYWILLRIVWAAK